jgi:putative hydrolase of the HAD superfamily
MIPFFTGVFQDCLIGKSDLKTAIKPFLEVWGWQKSVDEYLASWYTYEHQIDTALIQKVQEFRKN